MRRSQHKTLTAQALGVNRKNIYRQWHMPVKDQALKRQIEAVHRQHPAYGHRRIALHLGINHKRAQRVMAKFRLRPPRRRIKRYTTRSFPQHRYRNQIMDLSITQAHQVWSSDLSAIRYQGKWWYLATVEDVATRQIMAVKLGKCHNSHLVLSTIQQAVAKGVMPRIFHSDQGNEFMATACTDFWESKGCQISVSDVASPWQNGYTESFYGRFKQEFGDPDRFDSIGQLTEAIYRHIHYYNHQRIHTALKMPPAVYALKRFSDTCLHKMGT